MACCQLRPPEQVLHLLRRPSLPRHQARSKGATTQPRHQTQDPWHGTCGYMWIYVDICGLWNMVATSKKMRRPVAHPTPSSFAPPRTSHMLQCYKCWKESWPAISNHFTSPTSQYVTKGRGKIQTFQKHVQQTHPTWLDVLGVVSDFPPPVLSGYGHPQGVRDSIDGVAWERLKGHTSKKLTNYMGFLNYLREY